MKLIYCFVLLLLSSLCRSDGENSFKVDIYPGFGWDHLRFIEMSPIYAVSNFNDSTMFQSCIQMIPLLEDNIQLDSELFDSFNIRTSDYSSNFVTDGSLNFLKFRIGGSYSKDYRQVKTQQGRERTVTLRNEFNHLLVDVILDSSCSLNPQVKRDLIQISNYITSGQSAMASYAAQVFVKRYGTHFTSRLQLGGSLVEEDYFSSSAFYSGETIKRGYKAAAAASFLGTFNISASFTSSFSSAQIDQYSKNITRKVIHKRGGDLFKLGSDIQSWQASIKNNPVIIRRAIENITSFIQSDKIDELAEIELAKVREEINRAVLTYIEMNAVRGCMEPASQSFNWVANVDDGSCSGASQNAQFGGFIRTCVEQSGLMSKCNYYRVNNFYTDGQSCPDGFDRHILHNLTQFEQTVRERCESCGFLWMSTCCKYIVTGTGRRDTVLYTCSKSNKLKSSSDVLKVATTFVYGGSFTSKSFNPITGSTSCPPMFSAVKVTNDISVCLTRQTIDTNDFPNFGGFYSCNQGNAELAPIEQKCPEGYSIYIMGAIDIECLLYVCLKFRVFDDLRQLPPIVLPPFVEIDARNQTKTIQNEASLSTILRVRVVSLTTIIAILSLLKE